MPPTVPKHPKLVFLAEGPGGTEDAVGKQMIGPAGRLMRGWTNQAGIDPEHDVAWENAVKCSTGTPTLREIRLCRPFTLRSLNRIRAPKIVCLGEKAAIALQNDGTAKVKRDRNRSLDVPGLKYTPDLATCTYHPAAFLHGMYTVKDHILADLQLANASRKTFLLRSVQLRTAKDILAVCKKFARLDAFGVDLEWSTEEKRLLTIAVSAGIKETYWWALDHPEAKWTDHERGQIDAALHHLLGSDATKIGHNLTSDMLTAADAGISFAGMIIDTFILAKMRDENYPDKSLEHLSRKWLRFPDYAKAMRPYKRGIKVLSGEVTKAGKAKYRASKDFGNAPLSILGPYNAWDAYGGYALADLWIDEARAAKWWKLFVMYMKGSKVLTRSSFYGFPLDLGELVVQTAEIEKEARTIKAQFKARIKHYWPRSRELRWKKGGWLPHEEDLRYLLFKCMKLPPVEFTDGDKPSVDKKSLQILHRDHKFARLLLETLIGTKGEKGFEGGLRKYDKLLGTYLKRIKLHAFTIQDFVFFRAGYSLAGAKTGRLSSRPNIQNIPKSVRKAFYSRWRKKK